MFSAFLFSNSLYLSILLVKSLISNVDTCVTPIFLPLTSYSLKSPNRISSSVFPFNDVKQVRDVIEIYLSYDMTNSLNVQELFIKCSNFGRMFRFSIKNKRLLISLNTSNLDKHFIFYMIDLFKLIEENMKKLEN